MLVACCVLGQDINRQKAGWVYLLTNSIEWPEPKEKYNIQVITSDRDLAGAFKEMANKRLINDQEIGISFSSYATVPENTDILYITEEYKMSLQSIISSVKGKAILVITEESQEKQYLMFNLIRTDDGVSFQYNPANILNQGLRIRPEVPELGGEEINVAALYRQAKDSIVKTEQQAKDVQEQIDSLNMLTAVAIKVGSALMKQASATEARIAQQKRALDSLRILLRNRELQLQYVSEQIEIKKDSVRLGRMQLIEQDAEIKRRNDTISDKDRELRNLDLIIDNQLEILIFLVFFVLLFILALFLAYRAYQRRRSDTKKLNQQKQELVEILDKLKSTQDQLILSEKLTVIGSLTDSFANDITNAVNYINSGIHIIDIRFSEARKIMEAAETLDPKESMLKTRMKVKDLTELKEEYDFDTYEEVIDTTTNSVAVGADRITAILKDMEPYTQYTELGKFGLTVLGRNSDNNK